MKPIPWKEQVTGLVLVTAALGVIGLTVPLFAGIFVGATGHQDKGAVTIQKYSWHKEGFGSVLAMNLTIENAGTRDVADIRIGCSTYGNSGTKLGSLERTIYDIIPFGTAKEFYVNGGFIDQQSAELRCRVVGFNG